MYMILSDPPYVSADIGLFVTIILSIIIMTLTFFLIPHKFVLPFCNLRIIGGVRRRTI